MKLLPLLIAFLFPISSAQVRGQGLANSKQSALAFFPTNDGKIFFEKILTIDSTSKEEIYKRAKLWALNAFVNTEKVNIFDEPEIGVLAFRGYFEKPLMNYKVGRIKVSDSRQIWLTAKIYAKAGKAKIVFDDIKIMSKVYSSSAAFPQSGFWDIESFDETYKADTKINRDIKVANVPYFEELSQELTDRLEALGIALQMKNDDFSF